MTVSNSNRRTIREQRLATRYEPELMTAHRRTALIVSKSKGLKERVEFLRSPKVLFLNEETKSNNINDRIEVNANETLYRSITGIQIKTDEDAYFEACKKPIWKLSTVDVEDGKWMCLNTIGKTHLKKDSCEDSDMNKTHFINETCRTINSTKSNYCHSCAAGRPTMRPHFSYLRRVSLAMKVERKELLNLIRKYDYELKQCDKALIDVQKKSINLYNVL